MRIQFYRALTMVHYILKKPLFVRHHPARTDNYNILLSSSAAVSNGSLR